MAWSAPMTAVAGAVYTAAQFNTYTRDNLNALRGTPENRCSAYHSTTQSITAGTGGAALNLDSEEYDTAAMHDPVTNNSRITIPSGGAGAYLVIGETTRDGATGSVELSIRKNGTNVRTITHATPAATVQVKAVLNGLVATDYLELHANPVSNTTVFGNAAAAKATRLTVIGPLPPA